MKKIINIILNVILVIFIIVAISIFVVKKDQEKYIFLTNEEKDMNDYTGYHVHPNVAFNDELNIPIDVKGIKIKADFIAKTSIYNEIFIESDKLINQTIPAFYGGNKDDIRMKISRSSLSAGKFFEGVSVNYNGKNINISNKLKVSDDEVVNLIYGYECFAIFPYKNDIYILAPITKVENLSKPSTKYEYYNNCETYGYSYGNGVVKYGLVNITSNEKTKVIKLNLKTGETNIKENKYFEKMKNAGIAVYKCFEVEDKIQIVFNNLDDIKNNNIKRKIYNKLKKQYKKIPDKEYNCLIISVDKKDFNQFVQLLSGGEK